MALGLSSHNLDVWQDLCPYCMSQIVGWVTSLDGWVHISDKFQNIHKAKYWDKVPLLWCSYWYIVIDSGFLTRNKSLPVWSLKCRINAMHHQKYANMFENTVLYGSNYWQRLSYTPQEWGGAKKKKKPERFLNRITFVWVGKRARLTFIRNQSQLLF